MNLFECIKNKRGIINCVSFITLFMALAFLVTIVFWMVWPYNPVTINTRPLPVLEKNIPSGGTIKYIVDYCKHNDLDVLIRRKFVDGLVYALPDVSTKNLRGCKKMTVLLDVPHSLQAGEYILISEFVYQVNPIRTITVRTHSEKFRILE